MKRIIKKSKLGLSILLGLVLIISSLSCGTYSKAATKEKEVRAVWFSYLDILEAKMNQMNEKQFTTYFRGVCSKLSGQNYNTIYVQVRPYGDAMYPSKYFPWSVYAAGQQGKDPGYDPLQIMIEQANSYGLSVHAWINPYRVSSGSTSLSKLSKDNPARMWKSSSNKSTQRNVLSYGGSLYYNPASEEVRDLITNGVKEIVSNYDVDGIIFDDYFYPNLGSNYKKNFDYTEYKAYVADAKEENKGYKTIVNWRRDNVNKLLKQIHTAIHKIDSSIEFGISPAGNMSNLYAANNYYSDVKKWMASDEYIDYITPQIYWSFSHSVCPYKSTVNTWVSAKKSDDVDLYISLAGYRAGVSKTTAKNTLFDSGWYSKDKNILQRQVEYNRTIDQISGFSIFRYSSFKSTSYGVKKELKNLSAILN
ncbi:MAG: family 10 glycosylhydrolase [Clostridiales bacterium]|nr:family 10 glycosylhydrolase [Clostridiales bacterium]